MIAKAIKVATDAHYGQIRRYSGKPYILHPLRVMGMVAQRRATLNEDIVAASVLHDVVEDCGYTVKQLSDLFNEKVAHIVNELSNKSKGMKLPRIERKRIDRHHLSLASPEAKMIKAYDRKDNLDELLDDYLAGLDVPHDFMELYIGESIELAKVIRGADPTADAALAMSIKKLNFTLSNDRLGVT
jgi:(p)ppGpp synthase/HD superfamily hydrolase